ncbi:MAG: phage portal protein [Planctomycetaceae bacterium]|jgi:lambda family phage portal protein|nr:phage portal protein [Planctomycetaceae bacterium]
MFNYISNFFKRRTEPQLVRFKYDAAQTTRDNKSRWIMADDLSADASMSPEIRRTIRNRARYETSNNSYARGLILTLADICIGTGARLQLLTEDKKYNSKVEQEFAAWSETINLGEKLKTLRKSKCVDGEGFAVMVKNPKVNHPVTIDLRLIECERVTTPFPTFTKKIDGIDYDQYGNPVSYDILKEHPGNLWHRLLNTAEKIPAQYVLHWYRQDRPEQSRGLSELVPTLSLFAQLRRYTEAVLTSAETAADLVGVLYNDTLFGEDGLPDKVENNLVRFEKGMIAVMPNGMKFEQLKAEQPTTNYQMFKREILSEIGRCLQIPVNIILGDSSNFNYASGRLDHQIFYKSIKNEQNHCEKVVLFPLLEMWYREAVRIGLIEERPISQISSQYARFYWDSVEHVDPLKEAKAAATRIDSKMSNLLIECAKLGLDWEDTVRQAAREDELLKKLGLQKVKPNDNNNNEESENEE